MRWARPQSLSSLILIGLAVIAVPLAYVLITVAVQLQQLSKTSQQLVLDGVESTRLSQNLVTALAALERTTRLYQILGDAKLLDVWHANDARLTALSKQLRVGTANDIVATSDLNEFDAAQRQLSQDINASTAAAQMAPNFDRMSQIAGRIVSRSNTRIEAETRALQAASLDARQRMFWQTALLAPLIILTIIALLLIIARPIRQIDRAISELGRGTLSEPIAVRGPTDLERLGRQLEWLRQRLLDVAEERSRFLRHMSHELKTPLANIREGTELLMDGAVGTLDANQREVMTILRDNGLRLQRLIENLLSFSAWQTESTRLDLSEFRIRPVMKQVLENQQLTLLSKRVRLDVKVDDLQLYADRGKLRLIFDNLLSNAIKYSPKGGTIYLVAKHEADQFVLDIADTGPGIRGVDRERIFDAFYTGAAPQAGHIKGTGIGLSVVLEFVGAHGGSIEIVDEQHPGAHFRVRMPLRAVNLQPKPKHPVETAHAA